MSFFKIGNMFTQNIKTKVGLLYTKLYAWSVRYNPQKCMNHYYQSVFGKPMDWENPKNLIEKINWLQLFTDTSLWTLCADKYRVREYIKSKGCDSCLNDLYGMWKDVDSVDFNLLPTQFVLKANHGCGEVMIVRDKSKLDYHKVKKVMRKWMTEKYGLLNGQIHYTRISPCIIAEKLLENPADRDGSLVDYKLWCFDGRPEFFLVAFNRGKNHSYSLSAFDLRWNNISSIVLNKSSIHFSGKDLPKPDSLSEMLEKAKKLSEGFPEVRVDFYDVQGHVVFGELTFTSGFGSYSSDFYDYLGTKIDLTKVKKNR